MRGEKDVEKQRTKRYGRGLYPGTVYAQGYITSEERWSQSSKSFTATAFPISLGIARATHAISELPQRHPRISRRLDP